MANNFEKIQELYSTLSSEEKETLKSELEKVVPPNEVNERFKDLEQKKSSHIFSWERVGKFAVLTYLITKILKDPRKS